MNLVLGNNGIVTKANLAVVKQENATVAEGLQFKVTYYDMDSIEDISSALQNDGIMDENGIVDTYTLLEQKLKTGNGSNKKDVYVIEDGHLYYYDKNEEKTDLGNLWNLRTADEEETDPDLFVVDDDGTLFLKDYGEYYGGKTWTIENLVIPKTVNGKKVKRLEFTYYGADDRQGINGWENITRVVIPEGVTCIGYNAFLFCTNLKEVVIPNSVTSIESLAFKGCTSLENINIPNSVTNIKSSAFYGCSSLKNINMPNRVVSIGNKAFDETLYYKMQPDGDVYVGKIYYKYKGTLNNNELKIKDGTLGIADYAFYYEDSLTRIIFPDSLKNIGMKSFCGCSNLAEIELPDSLINIDEEAFYSCGGLTSLIIPSSVTSIGMRAFQYCTGLTSITIQDGKNITIGANAFYRCFELKEINLPASITNIDNGAFQYCTGLTSITISSGVTSIGNGVFSGCIDLTNIKVDENNTTYDSRDNCNAIIEKKTNKLVTGCKTTIIPNGITNIGDYAFSECTKLTNITIPDSVTSIGSNVFYKCTGLISISIPNSVVSIGDVAFLGCTGLTNIIIPSGVTTIEDGVFFECSGLTNITIPNGVTTIEHEAFAHCTGLTSLIIPSSVTNIGMYAFEDCTGLTSITIPESVTTVGYCAFYGCTGVTSITIPESVTTVEYGAFKEWTSDQTINCEAAEKPEGWVSSWNYGCNAQINWNVK